MQGDVKLKVYLISYEISRYSKKIYQLYRIIKECSINEKWVQCINNIWKIKSNLDINTIYEKIKDVLDNSDCFIIIEVTDNAEGWLDTKVWEYLNSDIFEKNIIASED